MTGLEALHYIVLTMNKYSDENWPDISVFQLEQFQILVNKLYQCCQERMQYQSDRFDLPDAEIRCLIIFGEERYLTAKGIAHKMNVVKSRVTTIVAGLVKKGLVQKVKDPEDSRVTLLSLTPAGQKKLTQVNRFLDEVHQEVLLRLPSGQRRELLANLELLKTTMQSVKDMMV